MTSPSELLRAIGQDPDNDALRLAYADLLSAARDPQGEFIRAQVELARLPENDRRRAKLAARAESLWKKHKKKWYEPCPAWARADHLESERGFPSQFRATVRDWCTKSSALLKRFPVHRLQIRDAQPDLETLVASENLSLVRILDLCYLKVGDEGARIVAQSPRVANLTGLLLFRAGIGAAGAQAIAQSPCLTKLSWLSLEENNVESAGAIALAQSPRLRGLRYFSLRSNRLDAAAGRALVESGMLASIERLRMGYMEIGGEGAAAILSAKMPKLKALEFDYNAMGDPGAAALAASAANLPRLEELDMSYNQITPAGMKRLAASKVFANLTRLRIANPLGGEGVRYLARCRHLKKLTTLELHGGEVGDEGAEALARSPHLANLAELRLGETGIGPLGGLALAASPYLGGLRVLEVRGNPLDAPSRRALRDRFGRRAF